MKNNWASLYCSSQSSVKSFDYKEPQWRYRKKVNETVEK